MEVITGGVCAAKGFRANGIHCGIRKNKAKRDLALIVSEKPANTGCRLYDKSCKGSTFGCDKSSFGQWNRFSNYLQQRQRKYLQCQRH